jgi:hypothetical protein
VLTPQLTLPAKGQPPPAVGQPARGPLAWWKLDETQGVDAADASGHRLAGRVQGPPHWAPGQGRLGGALELDGTQNYVACGSAEPLSLYDAVSVSLWLKPANSRQPMQTLVAKGDDTWRLQAEGDPARLAFTLSGPRTTGKDRLKPARAAASRALTDGQWHHVVGTYDGKRVALYVDGELQHELAAIGPLALSTEPLWLGNNAGQPAQFYQGSLDDVRLYGFGLTAEEIKALYHDGARPGVGQ